MDSNTSKIPQRNSKVKDITNRPISRTRHHNLEILSWNIQDSQIKNEGGKTADTNFLKILHSAQIFCLQETKGEIKIADYRCYNVLRKRSRSGGLCIGIHQSILKGIKYLNNTSNPDLQAIKLSKAFFKLKNDIVLINVYNSPENSSYKLNNQQEECTIDLVSQYISKLAETGVDIMLMGDFNARIANKEDFLLPDKHQDLGPSFNSPYESQITPRNTKDSVTNTNSSDFLDLLIANSLKLLNRTLGDCFGELTCLKHNGNSIVDYIAVSDNLIPNIRFFKIDPFTPFSDHKPIRTKFLTESYYMLTNDSLNFNLALRFLEAKYLR